jgi:DNA polymerase-3 subunit beta
MKLTVEKSQLSTAIQRTQGTLGERSTSHVALKTDDGLLVVSATDRVLAVYSTIGCNIDEAGICFVPGRLFSDVVRQLPDGDVMIHTRDGFAVIESVSGFVMKLPLIEDLSWKDAPEIVSTNTADLPSVQINYMIEQVQFCIEVESARNYGSVAYLHRPEEKKLRIVGTDGFRLSYCDVPVNLPEGFLKNGICLSKRGLLELHRMCSEGFETIRLTIASDETTMIAEAGQYRIYIRLSAVKYPNYRGVLPTASLHPIQLSRQNLQSVTRRVLLAADKTNALRISFSDVGITMSSKTAGSSESQETISAQGYRGGKTHLAINGKYLSDVFSHLASDELTMQFKSEQEPIIILPREEPYECKSVHVLVPIRENV